jgi:hypothetical protein
LLLRLAVSVFKIGILLGMSIFNFGAIVWLFPNNVEGNGLKKIGKELMQSSAVLFVSALIFYIWWCIA